MRAGQGQTNSMIKNLVLVKELSEALVQQRARHAVFWSETVEVAAALNVDELILKRRTRPLRRLDNGAQSAHPKTPEERYKRVFIQGIDRIEGRYNGDVRSDDLILITGDRAAVDETAQFHVLYTGRLHLQVQSMHGVRSLLHVSKLSVVELSGNNNGLL